MWLLRRIAGKALLWSATIAAALAYRKVAAWWPGARTVSDAARPIARLSREQCGPSVEEAFEQFNRRGPQWVSPPDAVE